MAILQIQHAVRDFDRWKQAFDSDPVGPLRALRGRATDELGLESPQARAFASVEATEY